MTYPNQTHEIAFSSPYSLKLLHLNRIDIQLHNQQLSTMDATVETETAIMLNQKQIELIEEIRQAVLN